MNKGNETWINNGVAIAVMSSGEYVQYDPKHIAFFKDKTLFLSSIQVGKTGKRLAYVCFNYNGMKCRLHRWVIGAKEGQIVDHKDRDPLNNLLSNLRIVTFQENMQNKNHYVTTSTGFRGVYPQGKKFRAASKMDNKNISLGTFPTKEEAARAYDDFVLTKLGDKAVTNVRLGLLPDLETLSRLSSGETKSPEIPDSSKPVSPWISVADRLPDDGNWLVAYKFGVGESKFVFGRFIFRRGDFAEVPEVTHWMPLPAVPEAK